MYYLLCFVYCLKLIDLLSVWRVQRKAIEDIKSRSNSFDADDEAVQAVKSALDEKEVLPVLINDSEEQEFKDVESYEPYVNANLSHFATPSHEEFDDHDFELISDEELKNAVEEMQKQADLLRAQAAESSSRPLLPTISFEEESRPNEPSAPPEPIEASAPPQNLLTDDDLLAMCPETPI